MWVISGPFDGKTEDEIDFKKHKVLRPGAKYVVGRKDVPLVIQHKKVSRTQHVVIEIDPYTEEDVENPEFVPKIKMHNPMKAKRFITHQDKTESALPGEGGVATIRDGDTVCLVKATEPVLVTFKWEKIACCCPPTVETINTQDCAKLGISVRWKPHPDVNYHLTPTYSLTPTIASSLLTAAQFAKPAWLTDLIAQHISSDSNECKEYAVQSISKYRPTFSPALPSSLKNHRSWEPNEARAKMLKDYRVIFVGEKGREANEEHRELVKQGDASYECCAVEGGRKVLHGALAKAIGKSQKVVLVTDQSAMIAAVGQDGWNGLTEEAASFELRFINAEKLILAVAHVDLSHLDCALTRNDTGSESMLPDVVLNTHPSEPTIAPPQPPSPVAAEAPEPEAPRIKLVRRARPESAEPASKPASAEPQEPYVFRTPLVRRALQKQMIVGIDDPSVIEGSSTTNVNPPAANTASDEIYVPRITLKRRRGTSQQPTEPAAPSQLVSSVPRTDMEEPPHKKYKDLFDASDPDKLAQSSAQDNVSLGGSLTQAETLVETQDQGHIARPLDAVPEEEEESTPGMSVPVGTQAQSQGRKRKAADEDVEMDDENSRPAKRHADGVEPEPEPQAEPATQAPESSKGRATSKAPPSKVFTNASNKGQTATQKSTGAEPGKPDKDDAFLKAIASTKRGKKQEDEFDREFNNLRISKPDFQREEAAKEWAVLDDFGDDANMRGNFMLVVELEVFKKEETSRDAVRTSGGRLDWEGRPNYKKFKKRTAGERPKPVEVYISDDEGLGGTWNTRSSQSQYQKVKEAGASLKPKHKTPTYLGSDSEDEEIMAPKIKATQPKAQTQSQRAGSVQPTRAGSVRPTRAGSVQPARPARTTQPRSQKKSQPLFVPSDDEDPEPDASMDVDAEDASLAAVEKEIDVQEDSQLLSDTPRRNAGTQQSKSGSRKKHAPVLLEDSDDDMAFKGFGSKRKGRR